MTTTETRIGKYEAMFLFPQAASADMNGAMDHIKEVLSKGEATLHSLVKWDERRLAYDIDGNKRGVYFLSRFTADTRKVKEIERDCRLSEKMLRSLIVRNDELTDEEMKNASAAQRTMDEARLREDAPATTGGGTEE
ncbi:MAG: 30S ribosomal protein S6 [Phycisphaerales bacterium]|jgi:small subunit ribosomal protein S6